MNIADKFELKTGKLIRTLKEPDLVEILKNENIEKEFFSEPKTAIELLDSMKKINTELAPEISSLEYSVILMQSEMKLTNLFNKFSIKEIEKEELINKLSEYEKSDDTVLSLSAYLCTLYGLSEVKLSGEVERIKNGFLSLKLIIDSFGRMENSYDIRCDLIDLIFQISAEFEKRYSINLINESLYKWLDEQCEKLHEFEDKILSNQKQPELDIKPEDLGLIDITRFKKEV